jgi:hypothetical protein
MQEVHQWGDSSPAKEYLKWEFPLKVSNLSRSQVFNARSPPNQDLTLLNTHPYPEAKERSV